MRILGLDYGSKTVGVAVSDELGITAQGLETISRKSEGKLRQTCARLEELIQEYQVTAIVLGYPKNMNNTEGERAGKTLEFKEMLERRTNLPVILWDERLSTVSAERTLMESGVIKAARKATSVLPKPTSPHSRRSMGVPACISALISSIQRNWSSVSSNGT